MKNEEKTISESQKKLAKMSIIAILAFACCQMLIGCGSAEPAQEVSPEIQGIAIEEYTTAIADITVDENVKIIGLGEATHGNVEFQNLKKEVFEALLKNNSCHVFAIEGDFGGGMKVNDYIHGGEGSARDAVAEIGFALYRTSEMENLIQWMHDYNEQAPENEQISFYGFDMQRYDNSKEVLFSYLEAADSANLEIYEAGLQNLSDATVYDQKESIIKEAATVAEEIQTELENEKEAYIAATDEKSYEIACECVKAIIENATLQTSADYGNLRDGFMKERVNWIYKFEGEQPVFITGHDGHIDKSGAVKAYTSMGTQLGEEYGNDYFAIGTDFAQGEVNVVNSAGERGNVAIENSNDLTTLFAEEDGNVFYLDFKKVAANTELTEMLTKKQSMINIGSTLDSMQAKVKGMYTLKMNPMEAYDSVIIVKQVTPTAPWTIEE